MTQTKRIALNTVATYGRSLLSLLFGLFSSRWVLQALGQSDFGLYGVVGSVMTFITYINLVMSGSVVRFFAFAIGEGKRLPQQEAEDKLCSWFNTALSVHVAIAAAVVICGYPIGIYAIRHWLVIPPDRLGVCLLVFRMSLGVALISMVSVPYVGMFTAHQNIAEMTVFDLIRIIGLFVGSFCLLYAEGDRLILYAVLMMAISVVTQVLLVATAWRRYHSCRIRFARWYDRSKLVQLFIFAFWRMFGVFGWLAKSQGSAIVVNLFFGAVANATYAVATQVSAHATALSQALMNAFSPAVTAAMGAGNNGDARAYAIASSKFSGMLIALFAVPLSCECNSVITLWLKNPPPLAAELCILFLIVMFIDNLTNGYMIGIGATGRLSRMTLGECLFLVLTIPVAWIAYKCGCSFLWIGYAHVFGAIGMAFVRIIVAKRQLSIPASVWFLKILLPVLIAIIPSFAVGLFLWVFMKASFLRLMAVCAASVSMLIVLDWFLTLNQVERSCVMSYAQKFFRGLR